MKQSQYCIQIFRTGRLHDDDDILKANQHCNRGCWEIYWSNKHIYIVIQEHHGTIIAIKIHWQVGPLIAVKDSLISLTMGDSHAKSLGIEAPFPSPPRPSYKDSICIG